ncbi:hypothetical protein [Intestinibacter sp.]
MDEQIKKLQESISKMVGNNDENQMDIQGMISKFAGNISPEQISKLTANISPEQVAKMAEMIPQDQLSKLMSSVTPEQIAKVKDMLGDKANLDQLLGFFNSNK